MPQQTIPVVDLEHYLHGSAAQREKFIIDLGDALKDCGFFALQGHGVDHSLIEKAYKLSEAFFDLPEDTKKKYEEIELKGQRGFTSFGREHAKGAAAADLKEFWHVGREFPANHPLRSQYTPNFWPTEIPEFREVMIELYRQLDVCSLRLLEACSLYIGERKELLSEIATPPRSALARTKTSISSPSSAKPPRAGSSFCAATEPGSPSTRSRVRSSSIPEICCRTLAMGC
jgi:isopenicillin N synthase-like dioxygenase